MSDDKQRFAGSRPPRQRERSLPFLPGRSAMIDELHSTLRDHGFFRSVATGLKWGAYLLVVLSITALLEAKALEPEAALVGLVISSTAILVFAAAWTLGFYYGVKSRDLKAIKVQRWFATALGSILAVPILMALRGLFGLFGNEPQPALLFPISLLAGVTLLMSGPLLGLWSFYKAKHIQ